MKTIIFKIRQFPHLSETFITSQIITAINCGFDVKLLITEVLCFKTSKQTKLLEKYNIIDKIVIENYRIPKNKICRLLKWAYLLILNFYNLKYIVSLYNHHKSFSLTWLYHIEFYKNLPEASVFHIQYGTNKSPVDVLKRINFIKASLVVSFHGHDAFFPINGVIPNNGYYNDLIASANAIIVNTPYLAKQIEKLGYPFKIIKIIPVGVDTSFFTYKKSVQKVSKSLKLITVGRLSPVKGHIYALKVIKLLKNQDCNIHFRIIGEGHARESLEQYILENDLTSLVSLEGGKSQEEVRELLWRSDFFLFTSVGLGNGRKETQGLATIEAQACGLPVIAFDSGGVKHTIKNNKTGYLIKEFDIETMAQKIIKLKNNNECSIKMGLKAVEFVNKYYSQDVIEKKWKELYERLS